MAGHRTPPGAASRVRSIIRSNRPAIVLLADQLPDTARFETLSDASRRLLAARVAAIAPSVGVIEVNDGGRWLRLGTCFRVSADRRRVATARHMLGAILNPGAAIQCRPNSMPLIASNRPPYRPARVVFERQSGSAVTDPAVDTVIGVEGVEWAHPKWDLMLLRLNADCDREPVPLRQPDQGPNGNPLEIGVIGYPNPSTAPSDANALIGIFDGDLATKRAAYGVTGGLGQAVFLHDASTLPGSSGSPIIDLATGEAIGIHYFGGSGVDDPNRGVFLPVVLGEQALHMRMTGPAGAVAPDPDKWPDASSFHFGRPLTQLRATGEEFATQGDDLPRMHALLPDRSDARDQYYRPVLQPARQSILPERPTAGEIGCQADPFSCVGFALASAINLQLKHVAGGAGQRVSPAMIYALATRNDEFVDDLPGGTSLRGAIKGIYHHGVCLDKTAPYTGHDPTWHLTIAAAKEARNIALGAYFRLHPLVSDYQLAVQEVGSVVVSAYLHEGWRRRTRPVGRIPQKPGRSGAHAFTIVGYDDRGFVIRNSWGEDWGQWKGRKGHAHWSYSDWDANVIDGWVLRLAPRAPAAFDLQVRSFPTAGQHATVPSAVAQLRNPRRNALIGHSIQAERDGLRGDGRIGAGPRTLRETALFLASDKGRRKYPRLALIFHDPALGDDVIARLSARLIEPFKLNGIYPINVAYGVDEIRTLVLRMTDEARRAEKRSDGVAEPLTSYLTRRGLVVARPLLQMWHEGIAAALQPGGGLWRGLATIGAEAGILGTPSQPRPLHVLSFGCGWAVAEQVLATAETLGFPKIESIGRIAPAVGGLPPKDGVIRVRTWLLADPAPADIALPRFAGDWPDLFARLSPDSPSCPRGADRAKLPADLATACSTASVLNLALRNMLGRKPSRTRSFI
ncbi:trypsin-like peptidase domain-containing protein [Paracoccus sp. 1_MG-2023]|nr:trypsin-like peptidase domain-containing protein [Paracoccus sp. 1_MG-2023]MDO6670261.1 trypsin-like peptidase domain-containing protein [Paracoccus sp. 1_MG-2023]